MVSSRGVIIVEVKDWGKETIKNAARKEFVISTFAGHRAKRKNPEWKCQVYLAEAKELMETTEELIDKRGRLLVPTAHLTVMPNLDQPGYEELGLESVLPHSNLVLKEDVTDTKRFLNRVSSCLPELAVPLSPKQVSAIRICLIPEAGVVVPVQIKQAVAIDSARLPEDVFAVDIDQEIIAKSLGEGPRLMRGLAGTGKTLIMLMRAKIIASNSEARGERLKILIVCWNISLANYMRQIRDSLSGIPLKDKSSVKIVHFMQLARELAEEHRQRFPRTDDPGFEEKVTRLLAKLRVQPDEQYDAIYVDEGQDFREDWISFLYHRMLKGFDPKSKNFIVAADDAQRIYRSSSFSWAKLDIPMRGRSRILRRIYRNSARVWAFAAFLLGNSLQDVYPDVNIGELEFAPKPGYDPILVACPSLKEQVNKAVSVIQTRPQQYLLRNILILYRRARVDGYSLIEDLVDQLNKAGIACQWITYDNVAKSEFMWSDNCVKISTVHSAKGMDAPFVIVLGAETFDSADTDETKLMYVGLTRAREYLLVLYSGDGGMVPQLKRCQALYKNTKKLLASLEKKAISSNPLGHTDEVDDDQSLD